MTIKNKNYNDIVLDILCHEEFNKLRDIEHHGLNRFDHSVRVSYVSYKVAKLFRFDTNKVTRAALLHDFFLEDNKNKTSKEKLKNMRNHPKIAADNADKHFGISELERDIIETHMFPITFKAPKYVESWIVDLIDDGVSLYEKGCSLSREISTAAIFLMIYLSNYIR
ncbi:MAG: HD domain-containing protein [Bacilli bacterium]|nr:HD domain-containing protein [Bacilli bacterium]